MDNIYDDEDFFTAYAGMERSRKGLQGAGEWHQLRPMFPRVAGRAVLDLGCGYGWHCKYAEEQGAARVLGLDGSRRMIEEARRRNPGPRIEYRACALEDYDYPPEAFGLEGAQGELFQAMADQDGGSWSLTIPRVAIRGVKELSPLQTTYFCTVQAAHYDVRGDRIVDSGSTSYRAVVTLKHDKDQTQFTWIAFSTVEEGETLSTLRNLGMNTLADQLEALLIGSPESSASGGKRILGKLGLRGAKRGGGQHG